jgi:hypothetical protein
VVLGSWISKPLATERRVFSPSEESLAAVKTISRAVGSRGERVLSEPVARYSTVAWRAGEVFFGQGAEAEPELFRVVIGHI